MSPVERSLVRQQKFCLRSYIISDLLLTIKVDSFQASSGNSKHMSLLSAVLLRLSSMMSHARLITCARSSQEQIYKLCVGVFVQFCVVEFFVIEGP